MDCTISLLLCGMGQVAVLVQLMAHNDNWESGAGCGCCDSLGVYIGARSPILDLNKLHLGCCLSSMTMLSTKKANSAHTVRCETQA